MNVPKNTKILQAKCDFVTYAEHKFVHVFCMCIVHLHCTSDLYIAQFYNFTRFYGLCIALHVFFFTFFPKSLL